MRKVVWFGCAVAAWAGTLGAATFTTSPAEVRTAAEKLSPHPRLHVKGPDGMKAILGSTKREVVFLRERCVKFCADGLDSPPVKPEREGRRLKGQV